MTTKLENIFARSERAVDPVCKMQVDTSNPPGGSAEHQGKTYYFCSPGCRRSFVANPGRFVTA